MCFWSFARAPRRRPLPCPAGPFPVEIRKARLQRAQQLVELEKILSHQELRAFGRGVDGDEDRVMIAAVYGLFSPAAANPDFLLAISLLAGFGSGLSTLVPVTLMRGFPAPVRFTGASFSYNVAYAIAGGVTPVLVQAWSLKDRYGPAHYVALCVVIGVVATLISIRSNLLVSDNAGF